MEMKMKQRRGSTIDVSLGACGQTHVDESAVGGEAVEVEEGRRITRVAKRA
jgi:hypothetical protein